MHYFLLQIDYHALVSIALQQNGLLVSFSSEIGGGLIVVRDFMRAHLCIALAPTLVAALYQVFELSFSSC